MNAKSSHVHRLEDLILVTCQYYPKYVNSKPQCFWQKLKILYTLPTFYKLYVYQPCKQMAKPGQESQLSLLPILLNTSLRVPPLPPSRKISKMVLWRLVKCCICPEWLNQLTAVLGNGHMWEASAFIPDCLQLWLLLFPPHRRHWDLPCER